MRRIEPDEWIGIALGAVRRARRASIELFISKRGTDLECFLARKIEPSGRWRRSKMLIGRACKTELDPNDIQRTLLAKSAGVARCSPMKQEPNTVWVVS